MRNRLRTGILSVIVLLAGLSGAAFAQDTAAPPPPPKPVVPPQPAWTSSCAAASRQAALECAIEQRLVVAATGQTVAIARIVVPSGKPAELRIQTPLGLFLPAGVTVNIDGGAPQSVELQTCEPGGCLALSQLSEEMIANLSKGQKLNISFQNLNKQPINVTMSLIGFTSAYQNIR